MDSPSSMQGDASLEFRRLATGGKAADLSSQKCHLPCCPWHPGCPRTNGLGGQLLPSACSNASDSRDITLSPRVCMTLPPYIRTKPIHPGPFLWPVTVAHRSETDGTADEVSQGEIIKRASPGRRRLTRPTPANLRRVPYKAGVFGLLTMELVSMLLSVL